MKSLALAGLVALTCFFTAMAHTAMAHTALADTPERQRLSSVNDGKADASNMLQSAIDAGRGWLSIPRGRYLLKKPLVVTLAQTDYCQLDGDGPVTLIMAAAGPAIRLVGTHEKSADPGNFAPGVWKRSACQSSSDYLSKGAHAEAEGIEAHGTMQMTVAHVHLRGLLHGVHLVGNNRNVLIESCHIYENRGIGIFYDDVNLHQSNIVGCHISYCHGGGIVSKEG